MKYYDVTFVTSSTSKSNWPESSLPEFCLAGRSNVGKSSFINSIVNRKNLAYVGKTPGKTQFLNFYNIDNKLSMVDVPGYGYASRSFNKLIDFGDMMEDYFTLRENLKALFLIVDLRHKPTNDDITMIEYAKCKGIKIIVVATKLDKLKNSEISKQTKLVATTLQVPINNIVTFSSVTKYNTDKIWDIINSLL